MLDGHPAVLSDILSAGASLEFTLPFGVKGGGEEGQPQRAELQAMHLLSVGKEFQVIAKRIQSEHLSSEESNRLIYDCIIHTYDNSDEQNQPFIINVVRHFLVAATMMPDLNKSGDTIQSVKTVYLDPITHIFYVNNQEKKKLTKPQIDVLQALYEAGEKGLSLKELKNGSKHSDARDILNRLIDNDTDWSSVIHMAGKAYGRYRLG